MFSSPVKGHSFDFGSPIHGHAAPVYHGNESSHRAQTAHDSYHINRPHPHGELSAHNMDRIFIKIIDEIHYEYMKFEKTERIRIENWVNKLVSTVSINNSVLGLERIGNANTITRKERNIYAKMLLNCVLRRALTPPFDKNPPDGVLNNFPRELYLNNKGVIGVHESKFWRHLYEQLDHAVPGYNDREVYDTHYNHYADEDTFFVSPYIHQPEDYHIRHQPDDYHIHHQLHTSHHSHTLPSSSLVSELQERIVYLEKRLNEEIKINESLRHEYQSHRAVPSTNSDTIRGSTAYKSPQMHHVSDINYNTKHRVQGAVIDVNSNKTEEFLNYLDTFQLEVKAML